MSARQRVRMLLALALLLAAAGTTTRADDAPAPPEAPPPAARPEIPPELRDVLNHLDEASAGVTDVRAAVTYTRLIPLLEDKRRSRGDLVFKKPDKLVLDLKRPHNEEVRTDGHTWWVVSHNERQVQVYETTEEGRDGREAAFLAFGYGRSSEQILEDYDIELLEVRRPAEGKTGETVYRLRFTPLERPDQPARYASIEAEIADGLWLPRRIVLHEPGGEIVHTYDLSKIRLNTDVPDRTFEYRPPASYNVVH
ncbi:MAG: outer membrane lipoprotein carrier protein LolA [Candidatus Brocadiaceae bacterium]|nr:outer membrane lipoprotein carrier protein LolA [Candidatus Brocadiaceae bacterium]